MAKSVKIKGLDDVLRKLDRLSEVLEEEVDMECRAAAYDINAEASKNIRDQEAIDTGELLSHQQVDDTRPREYFVFNDAFHAAFVEFGTGKQFEAQPEWKDIAAEWKGKQNGTFADFVSKLKEWCNRKGIDEKHAYPIAVSILNNGLKARPFMQPAVNLVGPKLIRRINKLIKEAIS